MDNKLGKIVQKSSGAFLQILENSRLKRSLAGVRRATFAFWNVCTKSAQKSVALKRESH
jgi:hypothetical protein